MKYLKKFNESFKNDIEILSFKYRKKFKNENSFRIIKKGDVDFDLCLEDKEFETGSCPSDYMEILSLEYKGSILSIGTKVMSYENYEDITKGSSYTIEKFIYTWKERKSGDINLKLEGEDEEYPIDIFRLDSKFINEEYSYEDVVFYKNEEYIFLRYLETSDMIAIENKKTGDVKHVSVFSLEDKNLNEGIFDFFKKKEPINPDDGKALDILNNIIPNLSKKDIIHDIKRTSTGNMIPTLYTYEFYEFNTTYGKIRSTYNNRSEFRKTPSEEKRNSWRFFIDDVEIKISEDICVKIFNKIGNKFK